LRATSIALGALLVGVTAPAEGSSSATIIALADFDDCPPGYVCLWRDADFQGAMLRSNDCCSWINLAPYGFNNVVSSWRNRRSNDAKLAEFANGDGAKLCLNNNSSDNYVGSAWNDRASSLKLFNDSAQC
jgi:hypothetical protein